jgi:hypothetical protein
MDPNSRVVSVRLPDSKAIIKVEANMIGEQKVGLLPKEFSFGDVSGTIESLARELQQTIERVKPKKAAVKFGLELGVESGQLTALLVKGSGKANLEISLEWTS